MIATPSHAATPITDEPLHFINVSQSAGITMQREAGGTLGKDKVTGQAWGDYDRDGWLDLYVTDNKGANVLYHNNQDGTFSQSLLSASVSLADAASSGAVFADYNNDGWPDLYVLAWGENTLWQNVEGQAFLDVTMVAGVGDASGSSHNVSSNSKSAAWGDYDGDGWLDLYVANWACEPRCGRPVTGDKDRLYHNNQDGTFTDVTHLLGGGVWGAGFVASFVDYDNDGDLDIYLVNDEYINPIGNVLWRNDGLACHEDETPNPDEWCFTDVSAESGAGSQLMGMGLAVGDYDNDSDLDFFYSNVGPAELVQNQADNTFVDVAEAAGVQTALGVSWGAAFFDADNDGWRDLYVAVAGAVQEGTTANPLYHNQQDGTFINMGNLSGAADIGKSLGVAYADYDNDGWVDLVVGNFDQGYNLYRNQGASGNIPTGQGNAWFTIELVGSGPVNRDAIGSRVYLTTVNDDGKDTGVTMTQMQEVKSGSSLGSGNALHLYFGVGDQSIREVMVVWADGTRQSFFNVPANRQVRLPYPEHGLARLIQWVALYGTPKNP